MGQPTIQYSSCAVAATTLALLFGTVDALAACDSYNFADSKNYSAARISPKAGKVHFQDDAGKEQPTFLLPKDEVVVLSTEGNRACVVFENRKFEETIGWLPNAALASVPMTKIATHWIGKFTRDDLGSEVTLKPVKAGKVDIALEAYWAMSLELAKQGGASEGGMGDVVAVEDGAAHIAAVPADNNNCEADLRLIGNRYLLVEDNRDRLGDDILTCAGHNVTFTGLYIRTK